MEGRTPDRDALRKGLQVYSEGVGPLVQHDYWCVIRDCRFAPDALMAPAVSLCQGEIRSRRGKYER